MTARTLGFLALVVAVPLASCGDLRQQPYSRPDGGADRPSTDAGGSDAPRNDSAPDLPSDTGVDAFCAAEVGDDPENCGRCGHSCVGGQCTGGKCQPVIFDQQIPSRFLSLTDQTVFQSGFIGAGGGTISTASPRTGGARSNFIVPQPDVIWFIANQGGFFYWVFDNFSTTSVEKTPFTDGNPPVAGIGAPIYSAPTGQTLRGDQRTLFYGSQDLQVAGSHVCVATVTTSGTPVTADLTCMGDDGSNPASIVSTRLVGPFVMDAANVYFTYGDSTLVPQFMGQDKVTGGARIDLMNLSGGVPPDSIGTDGRYVWFADSAVNQIVRLNVGSSLQSGSDVFDIPANDAVPAIFGDGTYVYWLEDVDYKALNNGTDCSAITLYRKLATDATTSAPELLSTYSTGPNVTSCAVAAAWGNGAVVFSDAISYVVLMTL